MTMASWIPRILDLGARIGGTHVRLLLLGWLREHPEFATSELFDLFLSDEDPRVVAQTLDMAGSLPLKRAVLVRIEGLISRPDPLIQESVARFLDKSATQGLLEDSKKGPSPGLPEPPSGETHSRPDLTRMARNLADQYSQTSLGPSHQALVKDSVGGHARRLLAVLPEEQSRQILLELLRDPNPSVVIAGLSWWRDRPVDAAIVARLEELVTQGDMTVVKEVKSFLDRLAGQTDSQPPPGPEPAARASGSNLAFHAGVGVVGLVILMVLVVGPMFDNDRPSPLASAKSPSPSSDFAKPSPSPRLVPHVTPVPSMCPVLPSPSPSLVPRETPVPSTCPVSPDPSPISKSPVSTPVVIPTIPPPIAGSPGPLAQVKASPSPTPAGVSVQTTSGAVKPPEVLSLATPTPRPIESVAPSPAQTSPFQIVVCAKHTNPEAMLHPHQASPAPRHPGEDGPLTKPRPRPGKPRILPVPSVGLEIVERPRWVRAGDDYAVRISVTNRGDHSLSVRPRITPIPATPFVVSPATIALAPGDAGEATISVHSRGLPRGTTLQRLVIKMETGRMTLRESRTLSVPVTPPTSVQTGGEIPSQPRIPRRRRVLAGIRNDDVASRPPTRFLTGLLHESTDVYAGGFLFPQRRGAPRIWPRNEYSLDEPGTVPEVFLSEGNFGLPCLSQSYGYLYGIEDTIRPGLNVLKFLLFTRVPRARAEPVPPPLSGWGSYLKPRGFDRGTKFALSREGPPPWWTSITDRRYVWLEALAFLIWH